MPPVMLSTSKNAGDATFYKKAEVYGVTVWKAFKWDSGRVVCSDGLCNGEN